MIVTIALIAEKKSSARDRSDHSDQKETTFSDRRDNDRWGIKRSISVIVVAAIAGKWFPYDRYDLCDIAELFFFLSDHSDRSDHMENRL